MADISRNTNLVTIRDDEALFKKHTQIQINEKESMIKALEIKLEDLKNVEQNRLELQIDVLRKEIEFLQVKLNSKPAKTK